MLRRHHPGPRLTWPVVLEQPADIDVRRSRWRPPRSPCLASRCPRRWQPGRRTAVCPARCRTRTRRCMDGRASRAWPVAPALWMALQVSPSLFDRSPSAASAVLIAVVQASCVPPAERAVSTAAKPTSLPPTVIVTSRASAGRSGSCFRTTSSVVAPEQARNVSASWRSAAASAGSASLLRCHAPLAGS